MSIQLTIKTHMVKLKMIKQQEGLEGTDTNKNSTIFYFMPQIFPDGEIAKDTISINSKQRKIFNVIHTWDKY